MVNRENASNRFNPEHSRQLIELLAKESPVKRKNILEKISIGKDPFTERIIFLKDHGLVTLGYKGYETTPKFQAFYQRWGEREAEKK